MRRPWTRTEVTQLASIMFRTLPHQVHRLVSSEALKGGPIVMLDSVLQSPRQKHLRQNRFWIQAVAKVFPASVPSAYFLAGAMLELNGMFDGNLLKVPVQDVQGCKLTPALQEAAKLKKLLGYLRYLFRSTVQSRCPEVAALKAHLQKNPRSCRAPKPWTMHPCTKQPYSSCLLLLLLIRLSLLLLSMIVVMVRLVSGKNDTMSIAPAARRSRAKHHPAAETEDEAGMHVSESSDDEMQVSDAGASDRLEEPEHIQPSIYALLSHGMLLCCGSFP